jgi:O-antigen/teichoic acid export membrane protein
MAIAQVVTAVTAFGTTIVVARLLGPDGVGAYTVAMSLLLVLGTIGSLGVDQGIAWLVAGGRWSPRAALRDSQMLAVLLGAACVALTVLARLLVPGAFAGMSVAVTTLAALGLPFLISWQYSRQLAVAQDRYEAFVVPPALVTVLGVVLCAAGAVAFDTAGMIGGLTLSYVLTAAWALVDGVRARPPTAGPSGRRPLRIAIRFGVRANAATALQLLNFRIDLFILSAVVGAAELGRYATAVSVTSVMFLAPQTLGQTVFPRVAALSAGDADQQRMRGVVEAKSVRHVSLITLVSLPVMALGMWALIPAIYGDAFQGAIELGLILLPGCALYGLAVVLTATINGRGYPGLTLRAAAFTVPVALVAYGVLIGLYGATGAAAASSLSYALNFALTAWYYRRATGESVWPILVPTRAEVGDLLGLLARR